MEEQFSGAALLPMEVAHVVYKRSGLKPDEIERFKDRVREIRRSGKDDDEMLRLIKRELYLTMSGEYDVENLPEEGA